MIDEFGGFCKGVLLGVQSLVTYQLIYTLEFRDETLRKRAVGSAQALVFTVSCGVAGKVPVQSKQSATGTELVGLVFTFFLWTGKG